MWILQSHKNVNIWGLPPRLAIVNYLMPMLHICSSKSLFYVWLSFGYCLCEFAWCGSSLICISICYLRNHLFPFILTMALPVSSNNWNYQQTCLKNGVLIPIFCHLLVCGGVGLVHHSFIPLRNFSIYSLSMTSDTSNCGGFCRPSSHWLLLWFASSIAFLDFWMDPIFQLVVISVVNKIWRVMILCACILYSNANIKDNAWILGEHSFLFRTLTYLSIFYPLSCVGTFNWY